MKKVTLSLATLALVGIYAGSASAACNFDIAKAKGVTFGRKRKLDADMIRVAAERYAKGETMAQLAEVYGVSEPTIWRWSLPKMKPTSEAASCASEFSACSSRRICRLLVM